MWQVPDSATVSSATSCCCCCAGGCRSDVTHTWLVAEVAIAATYVLLMTMSDCNAADGAAEKQQALEAVAHVLVSHGRVIITSFGNQLPAQYQDSFVPAHTPCQ